MALTCRQCGVIGSVVDTICRNCGTVLTNGLMPAINNPGSIAYYDGNHMPGQTPQSGNNSNGQYNPYPNNGQNWQNQYQNNNLPSWQGQSQQPNWSNPVYQQQYPQQQYPQQQYPQQQYPQQQYPQQQYPQQSQAQQQVPPTQMQKWSGQAQSPWGQPQQVFIVNNVHPVGLYQERKSPGLSVLLSFLLTGAGQLYNGQVAKGILMLGTCVILWGFLLGWVVTLWSIYDAYITAKKINSGQRV